MTPATEAMVERLEERAASYRQGGPSSEHSAAFLDDAAAALRALSDSHEGLDEDLYQAVLVAYRRGAHEWARLNYPMWIDRIARDAADHVSDARQMVRAEQIAENAKNPDEIGEA